MQTRLVLAPLAILLAAGCGSPSTPARADGGVVSVFAEPEGSGFRVDLYSSASAPLPAIPVGDGRCVVTPHSEAGSTKITVKDLDLGTKIQFLAGCNVLDGELDGGSGYDGFIPLPGAERLEIDHEGPVFSYAGVQAGLNGFGSTWTMLERRGLASKSESDAVASVSVPGQVFQDPSLMVNGAIVAGEPAVAAWTGGDGAQVFHVFADGDDASADCYAAPGATSFTIPAEVTAQLGGGAFALVSAENWSTARIAERDVLILGVSQNLD